MGCFPACFGQLRRNATMKRVQDQCLSPSDEQHESVKFSPAKTESHKKEEEEIVNPTKLISESEDEMDKSNEEKIVLDHSNVKKSTNEVGSSNSNKLVENENGNAEKEREKGKEDESGSNFWSGNQDFLINDRECAQVDSKENSLQCSPVQEDSVGSLFSLSIDSRKHFLAAEMGEKEVSSVFKMNTSFNCDGDKENVPLSKYPMIEQSSDKSKPLSDRQCKRRDSETSLWSWLVESEKSPQKMSVGSSPESENNYGDRLILGVIDSPVVIKELNGFSSAGSTPCCSADDQPGLGTVGRYWRRRGPPVDVGSGSSCRQVSTRV